MRQQARVFQYLFEGKHWHGSADVAAQPAAEPKPFSDLHGNTPQHLAGCRRPMDTPGQCQSLETGNFRLSIENSAPDIDAAEASPKHICLGPDHQFAYCILQGIKGCALTSRCPLDTSIGVERQRIFAAPINKGGMNPALVR